MATNTPFRAVDHVEFKKLADMLRPGTSLADSDKVGGTLLDNLYSEALEVVKARILGGFMVTLCVDGWSNVRNDPVLGISISCCRG